MRVLETNGKARWMLGSAGDFRGSRGTHTQSSYNNLTAASNVQYCTYFDEGWKPGY